MERRAFLAMLGGAASVLSGAAGAQTPGAGAYEVVVHFLGGDPDAVFDFGVISGGAIYRKSSYLLDREGTSVASPLVTIVDDPLIPRGPGSRPYDGEGLLSRTNSIVERGVLKSYQLDTYSAKKLESKSTANASRGSSGGVGVGSTNFHLKAGDMTPEDLLKSTKRGLFVTNCWATPVGGAAMAHSRPPSWAAAAASTPKT